jgi:predicted transcriptional regulator
VSSDKKNKISESEADSDTQSKLAVLSAERPDLYVLARVIEILKEKGGMKRTALSTASGLAYNRFVKYLEWMKEREFVTIDEEGNVRLSLRGIEVYEQLVKWILDNVGKLKFPKL